MNKKSSSVFSAKRKITEREKIKKESSEYDIILEKKIADWKKHYCGFILK